MLDITCRPLVMAIINRTPDSFSEKGKYFSLDKFMARAQEVVLEGADIFDVGGVKAGPGPAVTEQEEMDRVVPAIEKLVANFDLPVSVDTWNANVARESFKAGACIGNDISGFQDPHYLTVAGEFEATVVATHIRLAPRVADPDPQYDDLKGDVISKLQGLADLAHRAGLGREQVILDAGLDLGKTSAQSLELFRATGNLVDLGYPVLLSASNKTFLGDLLGLDVDQREDCSIAACGLAVASGARILRVHHVAGTRKVCDGLEMILAKSKELVEGP